jgi:serine/threonine-protein kinase
LPDGQTTFGRYRLVKRIAVGGMAEIYHAIEHGLEGVRRRVVLKRVLPERLESPDFVAMFLDEARVASQLSHPNIAHIYNFGEVEGVYFLAMEYVEGLTVSKLIQRTKPERIPIEVTLRIVSDVCAGLHHAHELVDDDGRSLGVVHRDVSPANVMVSCNGVAKIIDFGVARAASQVHSTGVDQLKGKLGYMAPEYLKREPIDRRVDVFALGAVLYEMVTGEALFKRESHGATVAAVLTDGPPSVASARVPAMIDDIIRKAVEKNVEKRYATALEMQRDVEQLMSRRAMVVTPFTVGEFVSSHFRETTDSHTRDLLDVNLAQTTPSSVKRRPSRADERVDIALPSPGSATLPSHPVVIDEEPEAEPAAPEAPSSAPETPSHVTPGPASDLPDAFPSRARLYLWIAIPLAGLLLLVVGLAIGLRMRPRRDDGDAVAALSPSAPDSRPGRDAATPGRIVNDGGGPDAVADAGRAVADAGQAVADAGRAKADAGHAKADAGQATADAGQAVADAGQAKADAGGADSGGSWLPGEPPEVPRRPLEKRGVGKLFLHTNPWSKVSIGGRSLGTTPIFDVSLPAGTHVLRLVDRDGGVHTHRVRIEANQPTKVFLNLNKRDEGPR